MIYLDEIEVSAIRNSSLGINQASIDSTSLQHYKTNSLAEALNQHAGVYIKSYGLGSLATSSLRGAGAKQSIVLWNGLSIQNPMLGLLDLSLIPVSILENVSITRGGNASMWGAGVAGGIFAVDNSLNQSPGLSIDLGLSAGSFGTYKGNANITYVKDKFSLTIKPFYQEAENDFEFTHLGETRKQEHAVLSNYGIMSELYYHPNNDHQFAFRYWYQNTARQIPASLTTSNSQAEQDDLISRYTFHWIYEKGDYKIKTRSAYFVEDNLFKDPAINLSALNSFESLINEVEVEKKFTAHQSALVGFNHTNYKANADAYQQERNENRSALFVAFRHSKNKFKLESSLRFELQDSNFSPITPSINGSYKLLEDLLVKGRINRIYNLPTLNDRYWIPGGNQDLRPEQGWNQEIGLTYEKGAFQFSSFYYHRKIKDQIIWVPGSSFWSPINLQTSEANGIEFEIQTKWQLNKFAFHFRSSYEFGTSVGEEGHQLIYTPQQQGVASLEVKFENFTLNYNHRLIGKVYTLTDNSAMINPYQLAFVKVAYNLSAKNIDIRLYSNINNIWNTSYQVILSRPMPGIHLETGMAISF